MASIPRIIDQNIENTSFPVGNIHRRVEKLGVWGKHSMEIKKIKNVKKRLACEK
jgi:hypothetical protein